jgi:ABC-type sugar transport system ATPase subunit
MSLLELRGINKSFAGNPVLSDVDLELRAGEVHGLIGENGAGKSTLIKIMAGIYQRDRGEMIFDGKPVAFASPTDAMKAGVSVVHQELSLSPNATVAENIYLRREIRTRFGFNDWKAMNNRAAALFRRIGIDIDPADLVGRLSVGMQQMVEVAKAIALDARVLIMDEPTSSLSEREIPELFKVVRDLAGQGLAIVFVSHKLAELFAIADRITVLRDGKLIGTLPTPEADTSKIIRMMIGRHLSDLYPPRGEAFGEVVFSCRGLSRRGAIKDVAFDVRRGEILGIAGLIGAGRSEAMRALVNADPRDSGAFTLDGRQITLQDPRDAVAKGVYYVSEDRKGSGLFLPFDSAWNLGISSLPRLSNRFGFIKQKALRSNARQLIADMDIRPADDQAEVFSLSGGNQQKVMIGKAVSSGPRVLIVDEPTRGVDVGSKSLIHRKLRDLANEGVALILISSEMPEVLGMSDRILVFRAGRVSAEFDNSAGAVTQDEIMHAATEH